MSNYPKISEAEWEVMRVVWASPGRTARGIHEAIPLERKWSESTVKTLIKRLCGKGVLRYEVDGRRYLYSANVNQAECVQQESRTFMERVFGGSSQPLLAHFLEESELDRDEIAQLRKLLDEKERDA